MKKSVIYRGSVCFDKHPVNFLSESIKNLRKWFEGEVIVSTWKNQEKYLTGINGIDLVVVSDDPGSGPIQQINRQIISFQEGLYKSSGDVCLITRTDVTHNCDIFNFFDTDQIKNENLKIFDKKITIGNMMSIIPDSREYPSHFRLGDWFHLGQKSDLTKWSDILDIVNSKKINGFQCTEQIWSLSVIIKQLNVIKEYSEFELIKNYSWDYILNNFSIWNTKSDLCSHNMNWGFQPEFLESYINRELYQKKLTI
jgi:hypothetical protein